jgi:two-component system OmpR family response regulator
MKKRVLVIDDDMDFSYLLKVTLELEGRYEVRAVVNSSSAVTIARDFRPDLILVDWMMPGMDGGQVVSALQSDPALKNVPFAFLTAMVSDPESTATGSCTRAQTFLPKTLRSAELVKFIAERTGMSDGASANAH